MPESLIEAARVDGATKRQAFYKVTLPYIRATIVTVATTTTIGGLKAFDIVAATTGGNFGTSTIANEFYRVYFVQGRTGLGSALAVLIFILVVPVVVMNRRAQAPCRGDVGRMSDDNCTRRRAHRPLGQRRAQQPRRAAGLVYLLVFLWTIPTFGTLVSSFRPKSEVKTTGWWTFFIATRSFTLANYKRVLSSAPGDDNIGHFFLNSMRITVPATILSVGIALVAAYAFSWMKFKGRDWLFVACRRPADGAAADGADPAAAPVHRRRAHRHRHDLPRTCT